MATKSILNLKEFESATDLLRNRGIGDKKKNKKRKTKKGILLFLLFESYSSYALNHTEDNALTFNNYKCPQGGNADKDEH